MQLLSDCCLATVREVSKCLNFYTAKCDNCNTYNVASPYEDGKLLITSRDEMNIALALNK